MGSPKSPPELPLDDVASLFARLGERESAGYRTFSMGTLNEPAPRVEPVQTPVAPPPLPHSQVPAASGSAVQIPAPGPVLHAATRQLVPESEPTPLQALFQRLAEASPIDERGQDSPLRHLRS